MESTLFTTLNSIDEANISGGQNRLRQRQFNFTRQDNFAINVALFGSTINNNQSNTNTTNQRQDAEIDD